MVALLSNTLRQYVLDYEKEKEKRSYEEVNDVLELYYMNKGISKYEYEMLVDMLNKIEEKEKKRKET